MTKAVWIYLTVIFLNAEGQPLHFDGWSPRIQPNMETCKIRKEMVEDYFETIDDLPLEIYEIKVTCEEVSV